MSAPILTVGVIADTHIPDRAKTLQPEVIPALKAAGVSLILHAGDISVPSVLEELETVAPVKAVRGNRDWFFMDKLPLIQTMDLAGIPVALMHGHGGWISYLQDKLYYMRDGYQFERYRKKMVQLAIGSKVIVYGHTHHAENLVIDGHLLFNPGSAHFGYLHALPPSIGFLKFFPGGDVRGEIYPLTRFRLQNGTWEYTNKP
jgi:putative phosphoesterase